MTITPPQHDLLPLVACIVSAHVSNTATPPEAVPELIRLVYAALSTASIPPEPMPAARREPAVPVKRSVFPDYVVCLDDGKKLKTLKRHLQASYGLTPEQYRDRWGLPHDYPMTAPKYAERRSDLAKALGLGRKAGPSEGTPLPLIQRVPEGVSGRKRGAQKQAGF